jgi:sialate O-acetylesterase
VNAIEKPKGSSTDMKSIRCTAWLAGLISLLVLSQAGAEEKLEPGKDRIDVPAIGAGLCLHNLFQTGMVLQRDKPIRIWGWAEPGEKVTVTFGEKTQSSTAAADRSWKAELPAQGDS